MEERLSTKWSFAWRMSFRVMGWYFPLVSIIVLFVVMVFPETRSRTIEIVMPLIAGLQAAFLFAPDDEPALELLLSSPRPASWVIYERLAALLGIQVSIGLLWSLLISALPDMPDVPALVIGWLPPTLALIGLAAAITFVMRRSSFGVLAALFIYGALLFAGDMAVMQWNFAWVVHLFLQRDFAYALAMTWNSSPDLLYFANRAVLMLVGAAGMVWILYGLRDEEKMLGAGNRG